MNITDVVDNVMDEYKMFYKYSLFRTSSKLKGATDSERSNRFDLKLNIVKLQVQVRSRSRSRSIFQSKTNSKLKFQSQK